MDFRLNKDIQKFLINRTLEELFIIYKKYEKVYPLEKVSDLIYRKLVDYEYFEDFDELYKNEFKKSYNIYSSKNFIDPINVHIPIKFIRKEHFEFLDNIEKKENIKIEYKIPYLTLNGVYITVEREYVDFILNAFEKEFFKEYSLKNIFVFSPLYKGVYAILFEEYYTSLSKYLVLFFETNPKEINIEEVYNFLLKTFENNSIKKVIEYFIRGNNNIFELADLEFDMPELKKNISIKNDTGKIITEIFNMGIKKDKINFEKMQNLKMESKDLNTFENLLIKKIEKAVMNWFYENKVHDDIWHKKIIVFKKYDGKLRVLEGKINKIERYEIIIEIDRDFMIDEACINFHLFSHPFWKDKFFIPYELFEDINKIIADTYSDFYYYEGDM
ncbi:hypothetical protein LN42_01060 [Marinitoga sp. 1137]|uniref:hypothetical protein n=1 Tax=Marinitoga sp. 1137 TaxID=1545835 RepID=UPI0009507BD9|nr:hypothetical protein [Marinitoga sp. 1137]APT75140.1 hypothetical protein LN42_01060 [Marinitoga sp. 1137]